MVLTARVWVGFTVGVLRAGIAMWARPTYPSVAKRICLRLGPMWRRGLLRVTAGGRGPRETSPVYAAIADMPENSSFFGTSHFRTKCVGVTL
jgi:hypothetical protein